MTKNSAVAVAQRTELVSISDGIATVEIAPAAGGALASYRWWQDCSAVDWLRPADPVAISRRDAGAMACFPLVPYSNRIRGGRFEFAGRSIQLPSQPDDPHYEHGHGWRHPWTVVSHQASMIVLRYRHTADTWPWSYEAEQKIFLADGRLCMTIAVHNLSDAPMPVGFGLHPYFPSTPWTHVQARVSGMWETDAEVLPIRHVPPPAGADPSIGFDVSEVDFDTVFTEWTRRARISWPEHERQLDIEAEAPLDFLVLYTPPGEPFFCAEPVSNITDAFNRMDDKKIHTGCIVLAPGQKQSASIRFTPSLAV
ncbi:MULTISPECIES: aldose 1-epimerase [unclassified Mesorhizobium]|uniref:aldose 1-epimerase n=1 Tax=unclassified Mesorhizobium TaxID=325217 RepID=UPI000FE62158|nr:MULTISPECIES: aldose 1-epimerase [unclassified Mesorhizobium]RWF40723.1 MAG: aldose 1-epimerase [Mesorhizobium sp.]TGT86079.1 aldose 1-epimerase [Mesorhizobium sp. M8A.F.Ca.ET.161.01.1.1]TGV39625.1 aldose 1-epimerase [Mesorhizobium sp. M8A.F.Ca.ET.142.01.1.1]